MDEKRRQRVHSERIVGTRYVNPDWGTSSALGTAYPLVFIPLTSTESTLTRGHGWPSAKSSLVADVGGNFSTQKVVSFTNHTPGTFNGVTRYGETYRGPAWPADPYVAIRGLSEVKPDDDNFMIVKGVTAISRCIPTNPVADSAVFLGELREGLPKIIGKDLIKNKFKDYRKVGSEYLNIEFGWKPIISDFRKFASAADKADKVVQQLQRDSGKLIRRKYTFPDEISDTVEYYQNAYAFLPGGYVLSTNQYEGPGVLTVTTNTVIKTKFSGAFCYHLNLGTTLPDRLARSAAETRKLSGLELTPEVMWNLAPWSWAADWFGNFGDAMHNISRFQQDGLVMPYGYIMREKTLTRTYTLRGGQPLQAGKTNGDLSMTFVFNSKNRLRATPFGFGFDMNALTGRQSAILGALGINRGPRRF